MNLPPFFASTGRLYRTRRATDQDFVSEFKKIEMLEVVDLQLTGWFHLTLSSPTPLLREPEIGAGYSYNYLLRRGSGGRYLLVSTHNELVAQLLDRAGVRGTLSSPDVNIPVLVNDLVGNPGEYSMSAVYARVEGYGQSLPSLALYGSDLAEASLFRQMLPAIQPHRVTLRHVSTRSEVLSVASRGEASFQYAGLGSLRGVDAALGFLSRRRYLEWDSDESSAEGAR